MSLIQGQGTRATKIDASAGLLRKVNKKLDRIIELLEEHLKQDVSVKEMMEKQRAMTKERND
tara:strand:+ start:155 stop:340 length:186 start_codon:yes stop_codon:yes gene_type:complete